MKKYKIIQIPSIFKMGVYYFHCFFSVIGTYTYANGDWYSGDWLNDMKHGKGEFHFVNNDYYVHNNKRQVRFELPPAVEPHTKRMRVNQPALILSY